MTSLLKSFSTVALCCIGSALAAIAPGIAHAQDDPVPAKTAVKDASRQGFPLTTSTNATVNDSASVEAVLIPPKISKHVFGKVIGDNYAVISLTVSNHSPDASLIVHSIFIDYSRWLLSGYSPLEDECDQKPGSASPKAEEQKEKPTIPDNQSKDNQSKQHTCGNTPTRWQTRTTQSQIASVESRIVRGELLDAQPWTARNWIIRALQAAGSIASAYTFTLSGPHTIQSIGAVNGQVIPAIQTFWPDATIGQMNRISDMGFQVNKVIPKDSSDIIVAFFPIDRFLTQGLRRLFITSPAVFFSPEAMAIDATALRQLKPVMGPLLKAHPNYEKDLPRIAHGDCDLKQVSTDLVDSCGLHDLLKRSSLNTVRVIVGGIMTVDVDNVPAIINSVEIQPPSDASTPAASTSATSMWTTLGTLEGVIRGSFLSNGTPSIAEADKFAITNVVAVSDGSTDQELHFKMTLTKAMPEGQNTLTFAVTKKTKQSATVESAPFAYKLPTIPASTDQSKPASDQPKPSSGGSTKKPDK
jgi:hypothetical protein